MYEEEGVSGNAGQLGDHQGQGQAELKMAVQPVNAVHPSLGACGVGGRGGKKGFYTNWCKWARWQYSRSMRYVRPWGVWRMDEGVVWNGGGGGKATDGVEYGCSEGHVGREGVHGSADQCGVHLLCPVWTGQVCCVYVEGLICCGQKQYICHNTSQPPPPDLPLSKEPKKTDSPV